MGRYLAEAASCMLQPQADTVPWSGGRLDHWPVLALLLLSFMSDAQLLLQHVPAHWSSKISDRATVGLEKHLQHCAA